MLHKTNNTEKAPCFGLSLFNFNIILSNSKENYRETGRNLLTSKFEIVLSYRLEWCNRLQLPRETIIGCDIQPSAYDVRGPTGFDSEHYVLCKLSA